MRYGDGMSNEEVGEMECERMQKKYVMVVLQRMVVVHVVEGGSGVVMHVV